MKVIQVVSAKGGVGTTTVACAIALSYAQQGKKTIIVGDDDICALLAIVSPSNDLEIIPVTTNLEYTKFDDDIDLFEDRGYDVVVRDNGSVLSYDKYDVQDVIVVSNDYLSLRKTIKWTGEFTWTRKFSNPLVVGRFIGGNALRKEDIEGVVSKISDKVLWVDNEPSVARAIDAGIFPSRYVNSISKDQFKEVHQHVVNSLPVEVK